MALTRKFLTAMGIEAEKIDQIIEAHTESTEALKSRAEEANAIAEQMREDASRVPVLEKEIEALKAADKGDEWKAKYDEASDERDGLQEKLESLQGEFDSFKASVEADKANAEKLGLYKGLLREIGLDEKRVEKAALLKSMDELTVGEDGKLEGYDELKASEAEEWAAFIPQTNLQVPPVATPPKSEPTGDAPNPRAVEIAKQRHEKLFGKSEE